MQNGQAPPRSNAEVMLQYAVPGSMINQLRNLEQIVRIVMGWSTWSIECFIRRDLGERYLTPARILLGWMTIRFFLALANLQNVFSWVPGIQPLASEVTINKFYVTAYLLISLVHLLRIWQRNHTGVPYHSYSFGQSWLEGLMYLPPLRLGRYQFKFSEWMLYRFLEPCLCFLLVYYLLPPSFTRSWLLWASIAMLIHNNLIYNARRDKVLDLIDGQIEGGYYDQLRGDAMGEQKSTHRFGYVEIPMPPVPLPEPGPDKPAAMAATVAATMNRQTTPSSNSDNPPVNHEEA